MTSNKTLWIVTAETEPEGPVRRGGIPRGPGGSGVRAVEVNKLQANLRGFLDAVQEMLAVEPPAIGDFRLEEVEIGAEITGEGAIQILGTGVKAGGSGGIKFLLRRQAQAA